MKTQIPDDRKQVLERRRAELLRTMPYLLDLEKKLLSMGGEALIFREETREDTELVVKEGRLFPIKYRRMNVGKASNCHGNSACLYAQGLNIATGYAMKEGLWRQHSWGLENYKTPSGKVVERIVETTREFDVYFGAALNGQRASTFTMENLGRHPNQQERKVLLGRLKSSANQ